MAIIISYGAVLAAGLAGMIVGHFWHSDYFWGRQWRALMGITDEQVALAKANKAGMIKVYLGGFILELLMAYVLAHLMVLFEAGTLGLSAQLAVWVWLGFVFPVMVGELVWEGKIGKLVALNLAHRLAALLAMTTTLFFLS